MICSDQIRLVTWSPPLTKRSGVQQALVLVSAGSHSTGRDNRNGNSGGMEQPFIWRKPKETMDPEEPVPPGMFIDEDGMQVP